MEHITNVDDIVCAMRMSYKMDQDDLVSVIVPTYNRFSGLMNAIESVRRQSYRNVEIIVVNDASTQEEYKGLGEIEGIRVISLDRNMREVYNVGAAQGITRNIGIQMAKGKWIAFLDDDDYWLPEKLQLQLYFMKKHNYKACSTNYMKGNGAYNNKQLIKYKKALQYNAGCLNKVDGKIYVVGKGKVDYTLTSSVVIRRDVLDEVGLFKLGDVEDWELWGRVERIAPFLFVDIMLMYYDVGHAGGQNYKYSK